MRRAPGPASGPRDRHDRRSRRPRARGRAGDAATHRPRPRRPAGGREGRRGAGARAARRFALPHLLPAGVRTLRRRGRARRARGDRMREVFRMERMWRPQRELKESYDVVIIGAGSHGLATAYYLAKNHGITDVAVLEQSYIGSGAAGRNTTIIRANYRTPEGAEFYRRSVELYEGLGAELDFNLLFSQQGHLTLAHSDRAMITMAERAEVNQLLGIDSRVIGVDEVGRLCPELDLSQNVTWPIMGALFHPPGGIIRHDAVVWGFARGADRAGAEIHPYTAVTGITRDNGRVTGVETNRGRIEADVVVSATAGWSTLGCGLAGVRLP